MSSRSWQACHSRSEGILHVHAWPAACAVLASCWSCLTLHTRSWSARTGCPALNFDSCRSWSLREPVGLSSGKKRSFGIGMCSDCHLRLDHSSSTELLGLRDHARSDGSQYRRSRTLVFRASNGARGPVKERTNGHVGVLFLLSGCHGTSGFRILHWLLEVALRRDFHPGRYLLRHSSPLRLRVSSLVSDPRTLGRGDGCYAQLRHLEWQVCAFVGELDDWSWACWSRRDNGTLCCSSCKSSKLRVSWLSWCSSTRAAAELLQTRSAADDDGAHESCSKSASSSRSSCCCICYKIFWYTFGCDEMLRNTQQNAHHGGDLVQLRYSLLRDQSQRRQHRLRLVSKRLHQRLGGDSCIRHYSFASTKTWQTEAARRIHALAWRLLYHGKLTLCPWAAASSIPCKQSWRDSCNFCCIRITWVQDFLAV